MTVRAVPVFFYGLFMDAALLREKGVEPQNVRPARVQGFSLRIGERAALVPAEGGTVHGMLIELTHEELDRLYAEPTLTMYRPDPVLAQDAAGAWPALCFNLPSPPDASQFNEDYAVKLRQMARRLGLPEDYIATIREEKISS